MASELSIRIARNLVGQTIGSWKVQEVRLDRGVVKVLCLCTNTACQHSRLLSLNEVQMEQRQTSTIRCPGWERHAVAPKEIAKPQPLTIDAINRMPADEYKRRMLHEPGFRERAEYVLAQQPKSMNRQQAIEAQENRDREARRAPHRKLHQNAFWAYTSVHEKPPFKGIDEWIALPADVKTAIIKRFDLENQEWKETF